MSHLSRGQEQHVGVAHSSPTKNQLQKQSSNNVLKNAANNKKFWLKVLEIVIEIVILIGIGYFIGQLGMAVAPYRNNEPIPVGYLVAIGMCICLAGACKLIVGKRAVIFAMVGVILGALRVLTLIPNFVTEKSSYSLVWLLFALVFVLVLWIVPFKRILGRDKKNKSLVAVTELEIVDNLDEEMALKNLETDH